jgi:uncharacterized protein (DUF58 family)
MGWRRALPLTGRGLGGVVLAILLLLGATVTGWPELAVLAVGIVAALGLGAGWVVLRPSLSARRSLSHTRVMRGQEVWADLEVRNRRGWPSAPITILDRCGDEEHRVAIPLLPGGRLHRCGYRLNTAQRGVFDLSELRLVRSDPLGLWHTERLDGQPDTLIVHPAHRLLRAFPGGSVRSLESETKDLVPHGSVSFHALREYVPGDDRRLVHWRSSARIGSLMVKENVDLSVPSMLLLVDDRASGYERPEDFEGALELAASVAVTAERRGYSVSLVGPAAAGRGVHGLASVLDLLAGVQLGARQRSEVLSPMRARWTASTFVAVTGAGDPGMQAALQGVARAHRRSTVVVAGRAPTTRSADGVTVLQGRSADELIDRWEQEMRR